ncbi:ATP-binding protein [Streptomyces sp. NPDC059452]|uniref:ATP-binding protein n=1 Tax=Streptomyces sp. NPDC059452 TaxID=3346835 RepID=UPI00367501A1
MAVTVHTAPRDRSTVRRDEFAVLARLVTEASCHRDAAVELTGDPGTGKTRLLTLLARRAHEEGVLVLRGLSVEAEQAAPFRPFIEALGSLRSPDGIVLPQAAGLVRALAAPPDDPGAEADGSGRLTRQCQYFAEIRRLITACVAQAPHGLLLLLDDFHWADSCSVQLMEMLVRWPVGGGLAIVVAHRPRQAPLALRVAFQHGVELGSVEQLALPALTRCQSAELLGVRADAPGLEQLYEESAGNPLYLTELAANRPLPADGAAPGDDAGIAPAGRAELSTRLLAECALLSPPERLAAHAAAVLGSPFDVDSVATVAGTDRDEVCRMLTILCGRDLVRTDPGTGGLTFRHPLVRRFLYYTQSDSCWRTGAHRRALRHLRALGAAPVELAPHIVGSGNEGEAADAADLVAAVRSALALGHTEQAAGWLSCALGLLRAHGPATGAPEGLAGDPLHGHELWLQVVRALAADGDAARAGALSREILAALTAVPAANSARTAGELAVVQGALGHAEEGQALIAAAVDGLCGDDPARLVALRCQSQLVRMLSGPLPNRADIDALSRFVSHADPVTAAGIRALQALSAVFADDLGTAEDRLDAAAELFDALDPDEPTATSCVAYLTVLICAESAMGWYGPAQAHGSRALAEARLRGEVHLLPILLSVLAYTAYQAGRTAEGLDHAQQAARAARAAGRHDLAAFSEAVSAAAWTSLGRTASEGPRQPSAVNGLPRATAAVLLLAEVELAAGDGEAVLSLLLPEGAHRIPQPTAVYAARVYELLAAAAVMTGGDAELWADRAQEAANAVNLVEQQGHALLARGHALRARCLPDEATRLYERAHALLGESAVGLRAGELARAGARGRSGRDAVALDELTLREREVAELAGKGLKTRDIAGRLLVSPRTVDAHLTRIYSKLGVNTRAALVRLLADAS